MPRNLLESLHDSLLSRLGMALLAIALLINIVALVNVEHQAKNLDTARQSTLHSRNVLDTIEAAQLLLHKSESAQRTFLYTENIAHLKSLSGDEGEITSILANLRGMVVNDPLQLKLVDQIRQIAEQKINVINNSVGMAQQGEKAAARALVMSGLGKQLVEELDLQISRFVLQEKQLLTEGRQRWIDAQAVMRWGFAAIFFINVLLLLTSAFTIMRDMARKRVNLLRLDERAAGLASEVTQRAAELRALSAHLLRIQEDERRTIARELHDELGGTLSAVKMDIMMGRDAASQRGDEKSVARLHRAHAAIDSAIQFTRRIIEDLRPTLLDNLGFEATLRSLTEQFTDRTGCPCVITLPVGELKLTSAQSTTLYRICQEALTNIMKYAKATKVTIALSIDGFQWQLLLADDGVGLEATRQLRGMSHGLIGMRERMVALGGTFNIRGEAGHGTTLIATFPVEEFDVGAV